MTDTQPVCHECENPIPEGAPMTQVRQGFCDGETVGDIDYCINYCAQCYADAVLSYVPGTAATRRHGIVASITQKLKDD